MRHLIKNGCFRTNRTIEWVCHNDPGCFQLFFHGFLATDGFISLAQKSLCDLQRTEQLNLFSVFLLYDCCQGAHGNRFSDDGNVRYGKKYLIFVGHFPAFS